MTSHVQNGKPNKKIDAALALLNEAAQEKKEEFQKLISERYAEFRETAENVMEEGGKKVKAAADTVDKEVHTNPWRYIGGIAAGALLAGYLFGRRK